jgi:pimeloyl-ACP methyl ester carboxylesterase
MSATSKDGTVIPYQTVGNGPGIVLVHGAFECVDSHSDLAAALAPHYTAITYNRRGRGDNPFYGGDYSIKTEVNDLSALLDVTGAKIVFGISSGALICLEAIKELQSIQRAILYEPVLLIDGSFDDSFIEKYHQEIQDNRPEAALVTAMRGTQMGPTILGWIPHLVLTWITKKAMEKQDQRNIPGEITLRMYAPTMGYDFQLVREMAGPVARFEQVSAQILLLGGSRSPNYLKSCLEPLESILHNVQRVEMMAVGHGKSLICIMTL